MKSMRLFVDGLVGFLILFSATAAISNAQTRTYTISENSTMTIHGTSNITDWEAAVKTIQGQLTLRQAEEADWPEADASWFEDVELSIPVRDIDADSRRMNSNMHNYLKMSEYPLITYSLERVRSLSSEDNPGWLLNASGALTVAGQTISMDHEVHIRRNERGDLVATGSRDLRMTDFGINPPTALMGSVRSHDEITITFELILN